MDLNLKKITKAELLELYYQTTEQNDQLKAELEKKTKELEVSSTVLLKTNTVLDEKKRDYNNLSQKLQEVNQELSNAKALIDQKNAQYVIITKTLEDASAEVSAANESVNALQEAIDELTSEHQLLKVRHKRMNLIWGVVCSCSIIALAYLIFRVTTA